MQQPAGRFHVEIIASSVQESALLIRNYLPSADTETAWMHLFETDCYPNILNETQPSLSKVTIYRNHETNFLGGILLELSTGSLLGIDASSYGRLILFRDGQAGTFRRNIVNALSLVEEDVPKETVL